MLVLVCKYYIHSPDGISGESFSWHQRCYAKSFSWELRQGARWVTYTDDKKHVIFGQ